VPTVEAAIEKENIMRILNVECIDLVIPPEMRRLQK
jgi:hypothetical protein